MQEKDIAKIIRESLGTAASHEPALSEAYVAQPKQYDLPAESVSKKTKDAHLDLYHKEIESLNEVSAQLDTAKRAEANSLSSQFRCLKADEVNGLNGVYLHELYFANSFDPASEVFEDSLACMRLTRDWGSFEAWQRDFFACAMSAREGWAVTGYSTFLKRYVNVFVDGHSCNVPVGLYPLIVLDMWTHACRDFENDKRAYFVSQLRELNWDVIEERFQRAEKIAEAVK